MKLSKRFVARFVAAFPVFAASAFRHAIALQDHDQKRIIDFEHEWLRALTQHDRAILDRILADDFVDSNWKGELQTKRQVLQSGGAAGPYLQHLRDINVRFHGPIALVWGLNEISDKAGHLMLRIRFTDVLLYRNGNWQAVAAQETPVRSR